MELHQTNVSMDGLIEVLGKNLYSTPSVAVRELIQNAHDACVRRQIEDLKSEEISFAIDLTCQKGILKISDNGSGLTYQEILDFLATIGAGYTRVLRNQTSTDEMIGYFGLGFLSSYVVADKVEVITTSYQEPEKTWHFSSRGGKAFSILETCNTGVGTQVILHLKDEFSSLSDLDHLNQLLKRYCCLLPIDIQLSGMGKINLENIPWNLPIEMPEVRKNTLTKEFCSWFEHQFSPLCCFRGPNESSIMWIQDASGYATSDHRNVSVFIRNMFITDRGEDLLPIWAGFIGCVLDTTKLVPTASREGLQQDDNFLEYKRELETALIKGLVGIARNEPAIWSSILIRHNQALLGAAIANDQLFELLAEQLTIPTSHGDFTLRKLSKLCKGKIFVRNEDKNNYQDILFKAQHIPVAKGYLFGVSAFCQKYADKYAIQVTHLDSIESSSDIFNLLSNQEQMESLKQVFARENEEVKLCKFIPDYIPLVVVENKEAKLKKKIESDEASKRISSAALALARIHTANVDAGTTRYVYLNLDNTIISKITEFDVLKRKHIAQVLRSYMLGMCSDTDGSDIDFTRELQAFLTALQELV